MIKIENTEVVGWEAAIRGMRNPMNSWEKSDSSFCKRRDCIKCELNDDCDIEQLDFDIGSNDYELMKKLAKAGTDHRKFMRMIVVYCDITAPLYWWKEFDTYKVGTVRNSYSTMHKITDKEFTLEDFSHEHLLNEKATLDDEDSSLETLKYTIKELNKWRDKFFYCNDKLYWWQLIQLLPSSYNQRATVMLNYEVLANIYKSRKVHKLDEWNVNCDGSFCRWIESLPYSEIITGEYV